MVLGPQARGYIGPMIRALLWSIADRIPSQCAACGSWPGEPICEACVERFAQPVERCRTCALPVAPGIVQCGACLRLPPPIDACLAAVTYAYPWSGLIQQFKFQGRTGWSRSFAGLLRSTPWVEPALEQAHLVLPMPLSAQRLRSRGFNQAQELARQLAPDKTDATLLLRIRDNPPQSALSRAQRLRNVRHVFAVEPLRAVPTWLDSYRAYWEESHDRLDELLASLKQTGSEPPITASTKGIPHVQDPDPR